MSNTTAPRTASHYWGILADVERNAAVDPCQGDTCADEAAHVRNWGVGDDGPAMFRTGCAIATAAESALVAANIRKVSTLTLVLDRAESGRWVRVAEGDDVFDAVPCGGDDDGNMYRLRYASATRA